MNWHPVETAPKDTLVLVFARRPSRHQVAYDIAELASVGKTNVWYDQSGHEIELYDWRVTHWMELPEAPSHVLTNPNATFRTSRPSGEEGR